MSKTTIRAEKGTFILPKTPPGAKATAGGETNASDLLSNATTQFILGKIIELFLTRAWNFGFIGFVTNKPAYDLTCRFTRFPRYQVKGFLGG